MLLHILAVGDVVSERGLDCLHHHLRALKKEHDIHFTVVNGENAAGLGLLPRHADEIFDAGADVITLGNHTWSRLQIADYLEARAAISCARPTSPPNLPGRGCGVFDGPQGLAHRRAEPHRPVRAGQQPRHPLRPRPTASSPERARTPIVMLVDFHAEATSEKGAMAWYLDGRAQALWGTHTHVPTADVADAAQGHRASSPTWA